MRGDGCIANTRIAGDDKVAHCFGVRQLGVILGQDPLAVYKFACAVGDVVGKVESVCVI